MRQSVAHHPGHVLVAQGLGGFPAVPDTVDHASVPQDAKVLRHKRLCQTRQFDELVHESRLGGEQVDDRQADR